MPDIFDQLASQQQRQPDIFDWRAVQQAPAQAQPDIFDQLAAQQRAPQPVPQQTQLQYQSQLVPLPTPDPQPMQRVQPGQPLQAGVEQNFWQSLPIVQDTTKAWQAGDLLGGAGSFMQGLPAGPLEVLDMGSNLERWLQEQTARAVMDFQLPLQGMQKEMVQQGVIDNVLPKMVGVAPKLDLAGDFKRFVNPKYPGIFGGGSFAGQALIPAGTAAKGASLSQKLGVGALGGALQSGLFDIGGQYRDKGQVKPLQTAASVLLGGGIGGLGAGAIHGLEKVAGNIAQKFAKPLPVQQPQFNPMALQGLDAQAQQEMLALEQLASQAQAPGLSPVLNRAGQEPVLTSGSAIAGSGVDAVRAMRNLASQADMRNFFGRSLAETPEDVLARIEALTKESRLSPIANSRVSSGSVMERAGNEIFAAMRQAGSVDDVNTLTESLHRTIESSFKGQARKEMMGLLSKARTIKMQQIENETQGAFPGKQRVDSASSIGRSEGGKPSQTPEATAGDFRRVISDEFKGRNRNKLAEDLHGHPIYDRRPVRLLVNTFGRAKVKLDYSKARLEDFVYRYKNTFVPHDFQGTEYELPGGGKLKLKTEENSSIPTRNKLAREREPLETGVQGVTAPTISGTLSRYFGNGRDKIYFTKVKLPSDEKEAAEVLRGLQAEAKAAEKSYEGLKPNHAKQALEAAQAAYQRKAEEKGYLKAIETLRAGKTEKARAAAAEKVHEYEGALARMSEKIGSLQLAYEESLRTLSMLENLEQELISYTGDLTAGVHVRTFIPHPEEGKPGIEFAFEFRKPTMRKRLDPAMTGEWARQREDILQSDLNRPRTEFWGL
ncbi:MAG: hypothetical protein J0M35_11985 [Candidatus Obscuribacter phosphatis]|uniref:Uncharacterized protein n=1 Tax=Candidatus Obscuribacter phosphatis TaxID=1906157 RepID=A0A8J7PGR5_9BACT|nr:hypothetical protein [Candidatus Obscuribacter phosphatis]